MGFCCVRCPNAQPDRVVSIELPSPMPYYYEISYANMLQLRDAVGAKLQIGAAFGSSSASIVGSWWTSAGGAHGDGCGDAHGAGRQSHSGPRPSTPMRTNRDAIAWCLSVRMCGASYTMPIRGLSARLSPSATNPTPSSASCLVASPFPSAIPCRYGLLLR